MYTAIKKLIFNLHLDIRLVYIYNPISTDTIMDLETFSETSKFKVNPELIDPFYTNMENNDNVYVNDDILNYMGFDCENNPNARKKYIKMLQQRGYTEGKEYNMYNNHKFNKIYLSKDNNLIILNKDNVTFSNKMKHLVINSETFKYVLMSLDTSKGDKIRKYHIARGNLLVAYMKYLQEKINKSV